MVHEALARLPYRRLGLKNVQLQELAGRDGDPLPWRVATVDRGWCNVIGLDDDGEPISRRVRPPRDSIAVGDWVTLQGGDPDARIDTVLPRMTVLERGAVDDEGRHQLIASNLDVVFVVAAFAQTEKLEHRAINEKRLERYVAAVSEGGAQPVVLLNKADIAAERGDEIEDRVRELSARLAGLEVHAVSAESSQGFEHLEPHLAPGTTVAFIGMSGVGKSSLINRMLGLHAQDVGAIRERDTKGRHTTSRRQLLITSDGALLIDTPGMRQFAVVSEQADLGGFDDVDELALGCRFSNCAHESEPGCAAMAAVEAGELPRQRLENYKAIARDAERLRGKHDALARHRERKEGKAFSRAVREVLADKKRR